jgi:hypothetical protein
VLLNLFLVDGAILSFLTGSGYYFSGGSLKVRNNFLVHSMSDPSETGSEVSDSSDVELEYRIEAQLGELDEVQSFVSDENHLYAVAVEVVHNKRMILVYEVEPEVNLLWIFQSLDPAIWGNAMWTNNEHVVGAAESVRETEQTVLVTEEVAGHRILKFLTYDGDEEDWRVFLVLHSVTDNDTSDGAADDSTSDSQMPSPCLSDESDSHP